MSGEDRRMLAQEQWIQDFQKRIGGLEKKVQEMEALHPKGDTGNGGSDSITYLTKEETLKMDCPLPPEVLADADPSRVHKEPGIRREAKVAARPEVADDEWRAVIAEESKNVWDPYYTNKIFNDALHESLAKRCVAAEKRAARLERAIRMKHLDLRDVSKERDWVKLKADSAVTKIDVLRKERDALKAEVERLTKKVDRLVADGLEALSEDEMRRLVGDESFDADAKIGAFVARHAIAKVADKDRIELLERLLRECFRIFNTTRHQTGERRRRLEEVEREAFPEEAKHSAGDGA